MRYSLRCAICLFVNNWQTSTTIWNFVEATHSNDSAERKFSIPMYDIFIYLSGIAIGYSSSRELLIIMRDSSLILADPIISSELHLSAVLSTSGLGNRPSGMFESTRSTATCTDPQELLSPEIALSSPLADQTEIRELSTWKIWLYLFLFKNNN